MKLLFSMMLVFFSLPIYAFPISKRLHCSDLQKNFSLSVHIQAVDQDHYQIELTDQESTPMPVYYSGLTFNSMGDVLSVSTSANIQSLKLTSIENAWSGEFWFDNVEYRLVCN